ncbi:MAG: hypothetical protein RIQ60_1380 [Pseudomonadota bacterium]|jgi:uncharacterized coiled-coil protein SlyX
MKQHGKLTPLALALAATLVVPAHALAQSSSDIGQELKALKDRIAELEKKLAQQQHPTSGQWGMTAEQVTSFNRIQVKTEALEDAVESQGLKMLKVSGIMDPTYIWNQRQHRAGFQFLNPISVDSYNYDNSYFGSVTLDLQKEMEGGTKFRLTLVPNRGTGSVIGESSIVQEASVMVPLGDLQTRILAGQIPDWSGYEYQQATLNKLITHNLLYDFTLPTLYTGAGMEYVRDKWDIKWLLANMNTSKRNKNEKVPVLAYRADYSRGEFEGFGFAGVHGRGANFRAQDSTTTSGLAANPVTTTDYSGADTQLNLFEVDGYFVRGDWTVQGQLSYGQQKSAAISADPTTGDLRTARWAGLSALLAYKFIPRWEAIGRFDYLRNNKNGGGLLGYTATDDRNGIGPAGSLACDPTLATNDAGCETGANRMALTLGVSFLYNLNTTFKAEYRLDRASQAVFIDTKSNDYSKKNQLLGTSVVVSF